VEARKGLMGEGVSIHSMVLMWREVHRATTPIKGFVFLGYFYTSDNCSSYML
jgi:hypothetical protein